MSATRVAAGEAADPTWGLEQDPADVTRRRRRLMWVVLLAAMIALPFLSLPGSYVTDTRDALWLAPGSYMSHALQLWRNNPALGFEQHDGIAFPMGLAVWSLHAFHLPTWVAERVWHGLLLFASCAFTILLVDRFRGRTTVLAPLLAGLTYGLTPFVFGYGLPFTGPFLAYVVLPLLLLIIVVGVDRPGWTWPAFFGLATLLMGGGNGAPQAYALITCALFIAWLALVDRDVSFSRALGFGALSLGFTVGLNASALFLLSSGEIANALAYSEVPKVINVDSSAAESIRGLGFWLYYGADRSGPWVPTVRPYLTDPILILAGFAMPAAAVASGWLSRWRFRLFFVLLAILSVFVLGGIFPVGASTPFGHTLLWAYAHVPGASGLRTTYKFGAALALAIAVLVGMGVDPALAAIRRMSRPRIVRACAIGAAFAVVAANAFPLWTGKLYPVRNSAPVLPAYWHEALGDLQREVGQGRVLFAPGTGRAQYRWGSLKEGVGSTLPEMPAIAPPQVPVGTRYGSNLLKAAEQPYVDGTGRSSFATLMRYLGVSQVVLQNDLDWQASQTARPASLRALHTGGLVVGATYGRAGENVLGPVQRRAPSGIDRLEATYPPVEVLRVLHPVPTVHADPADPVLVAGDGFGISTAAGAGLLGSNPPVLYTGLLSPQALDAILPQHPRIIVTDSNRRRVWAFTTPLGRSSATLAAGQTIGERSTGFALFGGHPSTQSVAVYPGLRSITASTDNGELGSIPQFRPALAFDGQPATWWAIPNGDPVGSWIEADLAEPRLLSSLSISLPPARQAQPIERVTVSLSGSTAQHARLRPGATTTIRFLPEQVSHIRVRVDAVAPAARASAPPAISDISIPGMDPAEIVAVPTDVFDVAKRTPEGLSTLSGIPITYAFERARTAYPGDRDEELGIDRRFVVATPTPFALSGTGHLNRAASDQAIDDLVYGPMPVTVTSSSRLDGEPRFRGSAALDGPGAYAKLSEWSPQGAVGEWIDVGFPRHSVGSISVSTDASAGHAPILAMRADLSDGSVWHGRAGQRSGRITFTFPPRRISSVRLTIGSVFSPTGSTTLPVGVRDITIPGVTPLASPVGDSSCERSASTTIDGVPLSIRLKGTVPQLLFGTNLPIVTCQGPSIELAPGAHDLRVDGAIQPDALTLSSIGESSPAPAGPPPSIDWSTPADGRFIVRVRDAAAPYYLSIGQNFSTRWRASIDGTDLGSPTVLDGYAAGWFVTRPGTYTIDVSYEPQRIYTAALLVSAASLFVAFGVLGVAFIRRRR